FAFSVPSPNRQAPLKRYHWLALPQGMKNSPTICQWYMAHILSPVRTLFPDAIILHYMDDILVCAADVDYLHWTLQKTIQTIENAGFEIHIQTQLLQDGLIVAPEKIQQSSPWKYLGWTLTELYVAPQKLSLNMLLHTVHDAQQLLGDLQWLRPVVGIPNELLQFLQPLLKSTDPTAPIQVTSEQQEALNKIMDYIQ
ncbi:PO113 protein, partial [Poecile atricapillus]|nr:PO113 protein [Poecile atricapillus]